jgi:Amt family ammonium transporter
MDLALAVIEEQVVLDSKILAEQFYFFTVVLMWLIHAGFMSYEAGVGRRKNVMSIAIKNILTIAVVTPTFYYFGWWIYGCFQEGFIPSSTSDDFYGAFCASTYPWSANMGPNLSDNITGVFWAAFLLFSWTTASIMSGALIERVRGCGFSTLPGVGALGAGWCAISGSTIRSLRGSSMALPGLLLSASSSILGLASASSARAGWCGSSNRTTST